MKVLIADDEALARLRLRRLLEELGGCEVVAEAATGGEVLQRVGEFAPDVLLLDIRMPGLNGLEAARRLARLEHPPAVIFTTAHGEYAVEAFEAQGVEYLLKPVRRERLQEVLRGAGRPLQIASLRGTGGPARTHICARVRGSVQLIPVSSVRYFRAEQKYVTVRFPGGEVLIEDSLKALEEEFEGSFTRVHRNALAADAHILGMEKSPAGHYQVRLRDIDEALEVSRRHVAALRRRLRELGAVTP
jgi:two-component system, LytTR family, response regulator AlgR